MCTLPQPLRPVAIGSPRMFRGEERKDAIQQNARNGSLLVCMASSSPRIALSPMSVTISSHFRNTGKYQGRPACNRDKLPRDEPSRSRPTSRRRKCNVPRWQPCATRYRQAGR